MPNQRIEFGIRVEIYAVWVLVFPVGFLLEAIMQRAASSRNRGRIVERERERERESEPKSNINNYYYKWTKNEFSCVVDNESFGERERVATILIFFATLWEFITSFLPSFRVPWKQVPGWWWWWWSLFFRVFVLTRDRETWWVRDGWKLWLWLFNVAAVGLEPKEETKNLARERERERVRRRWTEGRTLVL